MAWILLMIQIALGATLILAATGKSLRSDEFKTLLRFSGLSERVVAPTAILVPILELGVTAALLLERTESLVAALGVAAGLLTTFTAWMVWVRARGFRLRCGCFGTGGLVAACRLDHSATMALLTKFRSPVRRLNTIVALGAGLLLVVLSWH